MKGRLLARAAGLRRSYGSQVHRNGRQARDWAYVVSRMRRSQKRQEERDWRRQEPDE